MTQNLLLNPVVDAVSLAMQSAPKKKLFGVIQDELEKRRHYLSDISVGEVEVYAKLIGVLSGDRTWGFRPEFRRWIEIQKGEKTQAKTQTKIVFSDCFEYMQALKNGSFDAVITDPPYGISSGRASLSNSFSSHETIKEDWDTFETLEDFIQFNERWLKEVCRVTKENGNIVVFGSMHSIFQIGAIAQKMDLKILNLIAWCKPNAQPNITCRTLTASTEYVLWICNNTRKKATGWTFNYELMKEINEGKQLRDFWQINTTPPSEKKEGKHPTQKPQNIMRRLISMTTKEDDLILDPFCGSGSTAIAAQELGRRCVAIEANEEYYELAKRRIGQEDDNV